MKNNTALISSEERLFCVIKGGAGIAEKPLSSPKKTSFLKGREYYLLAVLSAAIAFFNGYYFSKADFNKEEAVKNIPIKRVPENKNILTEDLVKNLYLVGIAQDNELNVMIEDKKSGKTFFLKRGDHFYQLKIKKILVDRVVLEFEGKEFELM